MNDVQLKKYVNEKVAEANNILASAHRKKAQKIDRGCPRIRQCIKNSSPLFHKTTSYTRKYLINSTKHCAVFLNVILLTYGNNIYRKTRHKQIYSLLVDHSGLEPLTSSMPWMRSTG